MNRLFSIISDTEKEYAFIDECGNFGFDFDKPGVSSHYIISAVVVSESKISDLEQGVEAIRKKYFQTGEMKSSGISKNQKRREALLSEISKLDFHHYTVVIDKRKINLTSGLIYKKSFIKYLNSMLHKELKITFPKLQLISDTHGNKDFMREFEKYVNERNQPNLFEEYEFGFINSKSNVIIQLADIIAGTISYNYEESKDKTLFKRFYSFIEDKTLSIVEWPKGYEDFTYEYERYSDGGYDKIIYMNSQRLVIDYINKNENSDEIEIRERVFVLKYLMTMLLTNSRYIKSSELIYNLKLLTKHDYSHHYFKSKIIAKLRDEGILISSSNKGYKIPETEEDIYNFVNRTNLMIQPMLNRIMKARERVLSATKNEFDILNKDQYKKLKKFFDE